MIFFSLTDCIYQLQEHASWLKTCPHCITQRGSWTFEGPWDQRGDPSPGCRHRRRDTRHHVVLLALLPSEARRVPPALAPASVQLGTGINQTCCGFPSQLHMLDRTMLRLDPMWDIASPVGRQPIALTIVNTTNPFHVTYVNALGPKKNVATTTTDLLATEAWNQFMLKTACPVVMVPRMIILKMFYTMF